MSNKLKALCAILALALALTNLCRGVFSVGAYWLVVVAYWVVNYVGGKNEKK